MKLPSRDHPELPEIEFTAMMLAQAAGVTIAEVSLFPASAVEGIGSEFLKWGKNVLAVRRFDREDERRIHTEDFAQILGAIGNQKYRRANIETVVRLVTRFSSDPAASVLEMIRRIAVDLMLGNGDSHLKNTSFIYPDGRTPQLSPAYDIVPTVYFQPKDDLALAFGGKRSFERITFREFERMAGYVGVSAKVITKEVMRTVQRANDTWPEIIRSLSSPPSLQKTLSERWAKLALFKGEGNPFRK